METRRDGESATESGHEETAEGKARILEADVGTAVRLMRGHFAAEMI
jgi:hypothetical protein